MRIIAEFEKMGRMSWFSHLDLQNTMQRALRRAQLPVAYSQGFNPHVLTSFATALSVGCQSRGEVMEVEMAGEISPEEFAEKLNACLPDGLKVRRCAPVPDSAPALMAKVAEARYDITAPNADLTQAVEAFLKAEEVMVEKRSKTKTRLVNIRPMVHEITCAFDGKDSRLSMVLEQTNANALKVELVMQALAPEQEFRFVRTALYAAGSDGAREELFEAIQEEK